MNIPNYIVVYIAAIWACYISTLIALAALNYVRNEANSRIKCKAETSPSLKEVNECVVTYIGMIIPSAFLTSQLDWYNVLSDITSHHPFISLLILKNHLLISSRVRILTEIATTQTAMCFALSYGLNFLFSRHDSCKLLSDEYLCRKSVLCSWQGEETSDGACFEDIAMSWKVLVALTACLLIAYIPISTVIHVLFDTIAAPTLDEIAMSRRSFSQPSLHERKVCGWSSAISFCGVELYRAEYIRAVSEKISAYRQHVVDTYEQYVTDIETANSEVIASPTFNSAKFKKLAQPKYAIAQAKVRRGVYNETTIVAAIDKQRRVLTVEAKELFDCAWGWNPQIHAFSGHSNSERVITKLIAKHQSYMFGRSMKHLIRDSSGAMGLEILYMFIVDLLGGERMLASKLFIRSTKILFPRLKNQSIVLKALAGFIVLVLNLAAVYNIYYQASTQGRELQNIILYTCGAQWVVQWILVDTMVVGLMRYFIPRTMNNEIHKAVQTLLECAVNSFNITSESNSSREWYFLNAPDFLFVANKLARGNTHLFESNIIFRYRTFLPGNFERLWNRRFLSSGNTEHWFSCFCGVCNHFSLSRFCSYILKRIGCLPEFVQRVFIQALLYISTASVLGLFYLSYFYHWVALVILAVIIVELRVLRCHVAGNEASQPVDEEVLFDSDEKLRHFPLPSPMKFTVDDNKYKRMLSKQQSSLPNDDTKIAKHAEGGKDLPADQGRDSSDNEKEIPKANSQLQLMCSNMMSPPGSPDKDKLKEKKEVSFSPYKGKTLRIASPHRDASAETAQIISSAEKLNKLYNKVNRKFQVMNDAVHTLESTLATVSAQVTGLNTTVEKRLFVEPSGSLGAIAESNQSGEEEHPHTLDVENAVDCIGLGSRFVPQQEDKGPECDTGEESRADSLSGSDVPTPSEPLRTAKTSPHRIQSSPCRSDSPSLEDEHDLLIGDTNVSDKHGKKESENEKGSRGSNILEEQASPPKIHLLGEDGPSAGHELKETPFNLIEDWAPRVQCGNPVIVVEKKAIPVSVSKKDSNEAKKAWRQQQKSLQIRRNLIMGRDGLEGVSVPSVDVYNIVETDEKVEAKKEASDKNYISSSPKAPRQNAVTLSPMKKKPHKKKKERHNTKNKHRSNKVLPVP